MPQKNPWERDWGGTAPKAPKSYGEDRKALIAAQDKAQGERDAQRDYDSTAKAVKDMGTGPVHSMLLDMALPDDGGFWDTLGAATIGTVARPFIKQRTIDARDQLKTFQSEQIIGGANRLKGPASDKDTAMARLLGVGPGRTESENMRIIAKARQDSVLSQARAQAKAQWISRYGSLSSPGPNGLSSEQYLQGVDQHTMQSLSRPRSAPPSVRSQKQHGGIVIDLNGNRVK